MKQLTKEVLISFLLGVLVPAGILFAILGRRNVTSQPQAETTLPTAVSVPETTQSRQSIRIPVMDTDGVVTVQELEEYLRGVVLAEMPADFEQEALRAQAVVARTYALRRLEQGTKHTDGAVCQDPACCQGHVSEEAYLNAGGSREDLDKVARAVYDTEGEVVCYQGELIDATYFSCSGGRTEDAVAVWGQEIPYLQATDSPGEEYAAHFTDRKSFAPDEVEEKLGISLTGSPENWFSVLYYTEGGGVGKLTAGGVELTGVEVRQRLGLRSTAFSVEATGDAVHFDTRGYGHRVGMSQYGADAMALSGCGYEEILEHYYQGAQVCQYLPDD